MRHADLASDGSNIYDLARPTRKHLRQHRQRGMDRPPEHHVHRFLKILQLLCKDRPDRNHAGVVHQHIDLAHMAAYGADEVVHLLRLAHVTWDRADNSAQVFQLLPGACQFLLVAGADCDFRSELSELFCQRQPQTTRSAGNQNGLPAQLAQAMAPKHLQCMPRSQDYAYAGCRARHDRTCGSAADNELCPVFHLYPISVLQLAISNSVSCASAGTLIRSFSPRARKRSCHCRDAGSSLRAISGKTLSRME